MVETDSKKNERKVLITGATGLFGRAIENRLKAAGHKTIGAGRNLLPGVQTEYLDVTSRESCDKLLLKYKGFDTVVHCAAMVHTKPGLIQDEQYYLVNSEGTKNILNAAINNNIKRFILISTVSVYGEFDIPMRVKETHPLKPLGPYGVSKKMAEDICLSRKNEIEIYILRLTTMYAKDWLLNLRKKIIPPIVGKYIYLMMEAKTPRYSLCSLSNGVEASLWAVEQRMPCGIYNVADYYDYSLVDILRTIERYEGRKTIINLPYLLPAVLLKLTAKFAPRDKWRLNARSRYWKFLRHNIYSTEKLRSTGFVAPPGLLVMGKE